jgi:hypothetical protein
MSQRLINRSPDLFRLRDEGYALEIRSNHLLLHQVPYVNQNREVRRGTLVSTLNLAGESTAAPETHVASFIGEYPCDQNGVEIEALRHSGASQLAEDITVNFSFSNKPPSGYVDYHAKMTGYAAILENYAKALDPNATAQTYPPYATDEDDDTPFQYMETASSLAGIGAFNQKLELSRVAIIGTGGSGSYVLDFVAKTPVKEIHLYDKDTLLTHNAFRAPGAASLQELEVQPKKVDYLCEKYTNMHRGVIAHPYDLDESNVQELEGTDFAFLCMDAGPAKAHIVEKLEELNISFIDVGMGIDMSDHGLGGILRATTSTPRRRDHFRKRAPMAGTSAGNEYDRNIQIAELNALNAALAVVKWKKLYGFYRDYEDAHNTTYTIDSDMLLSEDKGETTNDQA